VERKLSEAKDTPVIEIRPYRVGVEDLQVLTAVRNATLEATTLPEEYKPFTTSEMSEYYSHGGYSLDGNAWLLFEGGKPAGAAILYPPAAFHDRPPGNFHLYIVPGQWLHGLGSALLAHLEREAIARSYPVLETTIAAEDSRSTRFLTSRGFAVVGQTRHLARQGAGAPAAVEVPPGYEIRSMGSLGSDLELYLETTNRLGAYDSNYSLVTREDIESQSARGLFQPQGVFLLFDPHRRIVGIIRASFEADTGRGYLNEIRLAPASRGKGLGTALVSAALQYLGALGVERVELDTAGENVAAYNLAIRSGFVQARHWLHFMKRLAGSPTIAIR
jgi:GNAT superfamily N-acetyltransferase